MQFLLRSIKCPSPRLLALSLSLSLSLACALSHLLRSLRALSRARRQLRCLAHFFRLVLPYIFHCVAHLRCVKRKRKAATCAARDVDSSYAASRQRVSDALSLSYVSCAVSARSLRLRCVASLSSVVVVFFELCWLRALGWKSGKLPGFSFSKIHVCFPS